MQKRIRQSYLISENAVFTDAICIRGRRASDLLTIKRIGNTEVFEVKEF
jgi:hypothetical protein